jgi:hypothetical protein
MECAAAGIDAIHGEDAKHTQRSGNQDWGTMHCQSHATRAAAASELRIFPCGFSIIYSEQQSRSSLPNA